MISSKNWVPRRGLTRHYGFSRGVEIVSVYSRSRKRRVVVSRGEAEAVRRDGVEVVKRVCEDCRTWWTPLWRKGPSGPRTLCNACGIRYRRKMRGLQPNCDPIKCERSSSSSSTDKGLSYEELKQRQKEKQMKMLLLLDWTNRNNREKTKKIKKNPIKMGGIKATVEDEEAALLLLSLSSAILLRQPKS